jgi:hypothetical protein
VSTDRYSSPMGRKEKIFQLAKGYRGRAKNCITTARARVEKGLQYAYRDRRTKKREFRSLWITRVNAGVRGAFGPGPSCPADAASLTLCPIVRFSQSTGTATAASRMSRTLRELW